MRRIYNLKPAILATLARYAQRYRPGHASPQSDSIGHAHRSTRARRALLVALPALLVAASGSSTAQAAMYSEQNLRWPRGCRLLRLRREPAAEPQGRHTEGRQPVQRAQVEDRRVDLPRDQRWSLREDLPHPGVSRVSHVGYYAQQQSMWLNTSVPIWQVVVHEFGHVIGLHHEHQRCERDLWLNVPNPGGAMTKECGLPTAERYNPMSIMHYSDSELSAFGASVKPPYSAPAKSLHPGLVESDLRTINTMYRSNGTFSTVSVMHGKCLSGVGGTVVQMQACHAKARGADVELRRGGRRVQGRRQVPRRVGGTTRGSIVIGACHGGPRRGVGLRQPRRPVDADHQG